MTKEEIIELLISFQEQVDENDTVWTNKVIFDYNFDEIATIIANKINK